MIIDELSLVNFRNYENLNIKFSPFLNLIYGLNGSGKTNLIESIYLLSLTKSFRINNDKVVIKKGAIKAKVRGEIRLNDNTTDYSVEISSDGKIVAIDGENINKISDYISKINIILFNPSDTQLIDAAPVERRKLLNIEISQLHKEYLTILANYQKILKQRNFYIRSMYINANHDTTYLDILTKKLIEYGKMIAKYRENFIDQINKYISDIYKDIFTKGFLKIKYVSTFKGKDTNSLIERYKKNYKKELELGKTLEGIHHDDILFVLDDNSLKEWGSEGQRKNAIISFKIAELSVIKDIKGYFPILILDDLFSELDSEKINNILNLLNKKIQTFITTTDLKIVNKQIKEKSKKIKVTDGKIEEE